MSDTEGWLPHDHNVESIRATARLLRENEQKQREDEELADAVLESRVAPEDLHLGRVVTEEALSRLPVEEAEKVRIDPQARIELWEKTIGPLPKNISEVDAEIRQIQGTMNTKAYWDDATLQHRLRVLLMMQEQAEQALLKPGV